MVKLCDNCNVTDAANTLSNAEVSIYFTDLIIDEGGVTVKRQFWNEIQTIISPYMTKKDILFFKGVKVMERTDM